MAVSDALPAEFDFDTAVASQGTCAAPSGGSVACAVGDIPSGGTVDVTVTMTVPPGFPGTDVVNTATVSSPTADPDSSDNTASFTVTSSPAADISVTKVAAPDPVVAGQRVTWTATVTNAGPSNAAAVVFTDPLPPGVDPASVTTSPGDCTVAAGTVSCSLGTVPVGASRTVTLSAVVLPGGESGSRLVNGALVSTTTLDPTVSNNVATVGSDVTIVADVTVTKQFVDLNLDPITEVPAGVPVVARIDITNAGPSTARDVSFVDTFDAEGVVAGPPGIDQVCQVLPSGQLECDVVPTLPPQTTTTFFVVLIPFDDPGDYTNAVTVATTTPETNTDNNDDDAGLTLLAPQLSLAATKTAQGPLLAGGRFEYQVAVTNQGPSIAERATMTDTLPAGLVPDGATADGGTCDVVGQTVTCGLGLVDPEASGSPDEPIAPRIVHDRRLGCSRHHRGRGRRTSPPSRRLATPTARSPRPLTRSVVGSRRHRGSRRPEQATFTAGGEAAYDVAISNAGPSSATTATLTDLLPADITFDPDASGLHDAPTTPARSRATSPSVEPGHERVSVRIAGTLDPSFVGADLINTASFTSDANPTPVFLATDSHDAGRAVGRRPGDEGRHRSTPSPRGPPPSSRSPSPTRGPSTAR